MYILVVQSIFICFIFALLQIVLEAKSINHGVYIAIDDIRFEHKPCQGMSLGLKRYLNNSKLKLGLVDFNDYIITTEI